MRLWQQRIPTARKLRRDRGLSNRAVKAVQTPGPNHGPDTCLPALDPGRTAFPARTAAEAFGIRGGDIAESGMPARQPPQMNSFSTL